MGVLNPAAMRYRGNAKKSLRTQARWTAGTIVRRYRGGGLEYFCGRWCPVGASNDPSGLNKNFYKNIKFYMEKGSVEL